MADEEQGFTFVDKRGTQTKTPVPDMATEVSDTAPLSEESDMESGPLDIYSVIGYCLSLLASEAWQKLGLIADSKTGEAQPDLPQAKIAIDAASDLAARLESAPADAVPESMKRDLRTLLRDLRLNFVGQQELTK